MQIGKDIIHFTLVFLNVLLFLYRGYCYCLSMCEKDSPALCCEWAVVLLKSPLKPSASPGFIFFPHAVTGLAGGGEARLQNPPVNFCKFGVVFVLGAILICS